MKEPQAIVVLGTGPNSSKSHVCAGLARMLTRWGVPVLPFKAVTVLEEGEKAPIPLHIAATGLPRRREQAPITVVPLPGRTSGWLHVYGEPQYPVQLSTPDTVDGEQLDAAQREQLRGVVRAALDDLLDGFAGVLIVEGAGSPVDAVDDLANIGVLRDLASRRMPGAPRVVLSAFCRNGGSVAAITGTFAHLPADLRHLVVGYLLNGPMPSAPTAYWQRLVTEATGMPMLGLAPYLPLSPAEIAARSERGQADLWADAMLETDFAALLGPLVVTRAPIAAGSF